MKVGNVVFIGSPDGVPRILMTVRGQRPWWSQNTVISQVSTQQPSGYGQIQGDLMKLIAG